MSFRSLASLRCAIPLFAIFVLSACTDDRVAELSQVDVVDDVPTVESDPGTQQNQNIDNPVLVIPDTSPVSEGDELRLVFKEEFDGPEINPETWYFETGDGTERGIPGWGNDELQYYLPDNAMIVNGVLEITARRETVGDFNYTSARINTEDRFAFKYGRIEASIKMPAGQGFLPAFWMLSQDSNYVCGVDDKGEDVPCVWAATGEIDIVEAANLGGTGGNEIFGTIHYGTQFRSVFATEYYTPSVDVTDSFNTYALEWDEDEIRWYFNGLLYATQNSWFSVANNGDPGAPFDQNFHILLNLAVGGNLPGSPNGTTPFPATMYVDWVRVYSGEDPDGGVAIEPNVSAPTPMEDPEDVISLFSDAYDDIAGIDYNPNWGQATVFTEAQIAGNKMLKYANLDFQGIDFAGNPQDVSDKGFLHLDVWTADSTALNVYLISPGPAETAYAIPVEANSWVSVNIPLTAFDGVDLTDLIQLKFDGNGTIFLDNLYFAGEAPIPAAEGVVPDAVIVSVDPAVTPDLVPGGFEAFGSGSDIVTDFAGDSSYDNALSVTTGPGYGGGILAQVGLTPFAAGFAAPYDTLVFKVKGLVDDTIVVKIEPGGVPFLTVDLTTPPAGATVTDLGDGWTQVELPLTLFVDVATATTLVFETTAGAQAENYTIYLTDIGFTAAGAAEGVVPDAVIVSVDPAVTPDLVPGGFEAFGSGSDIVTDFAGDSSYDNALSVTTGPGYGGGILAQVGLTPFAAGFAAPYDTLVFKVKGLVDDTIVVKIEPGGVPFLTVDLTTPPAGATVTDLGDGWTQVELPLTLFVDVATATTLVFETTAGAQAENYTIYLTDIGFTAAGAAEGVVPDAVIVSVDPAVTPDLVPGGFEAFGSGSDIVTDFAGDSSYDNALSVTTGPGYGGGILAQVGLTPFAAGFAAPYDTLVFKVKGLVDDTIVVKIEPGGVPFLTVDLTTPPAGATVTDLGDGWTQVELPLTLFVDVATATTLVFETTAGAQAENYTIYLTDIGFTAAGAAEGVVPDAVIVSVDPAVTPDLVPGGFEAFGSGSDIVTDFAGDSSYDNALSVTTGPGYGGGILAQVGLTPFAAGFAAPYDTLVFKVKGLVDDTIVVKIEPGGVPFLTVDLTTPPAGATVTDLGDGWTQVELPLTLFVDVATATTLVFETTAGAQAENYTIYLTDIGFTAAGAAEGVVPDAVIVSVDPAVTPDLVPGGFEAFGSGSDIVTDFAGDSSYDNALSVTTGPGYGGGILAQVGLTPFAAGFAAPYDTLVFKVKGLVDDTIVVKIEPGGVPFLTVDLTTPPAGATVTDLGDGWTQVELPLTLFVDVATATTLVFETTAGAQAENYTIYLTDIGFTAAGAAEGVVPDAVIVSVDPAVTPDLVPGGFEAFGSGSDIVTDFAGDSSYDNALSVTTGPGYGGGILAQVGLTPFAAGFAAPYDTLVFKVKGLVDDTIVVKIEPGGVPFLTVDLTTPPAGATVTDLGDGWTQVELPLTLFVDVATATTLVFETTAGAQAENYTIYLTDIGFNNAGGGGDELAVNGGFEDGNLDGWTVFDGGGVAEVVNTGANEGTYAGHGVATESGGAAQTVVFKQFELAQGVVTPGATVDISFDLKGTVGTGGVVNVAFFSEKTAGADRIGLFGPPDSPTPGWSSYTYTVTAGPDLSRGITLEFAISSSADTGSFADVFIDNVSIVVP